MLTESQTKIYGKMINLILLPNLTNEERKYLLIAKQSLDNDNNFQEVISRLGRALTTLDSRVYQEGGLTPEVKKFFTELKVFYGSPQDHQFYRARFLPVFGGPLGGGGASKGITRRFLAYYLVMLTVMVLGALWIFGVFR